MIHATLIDKTNTKTFLMTAVKEPHKGVLWGFFAWGSCTCADISALR